MKPFGIRELRAPAWMKLFLIGSVVLTSALAAGEYSKSGLTWVFATLAAISVFTAVAVLDAFTAYIRVTDNSIEIRSNFRRRSYTRDSFEDANWSWGGPVSLKRRDGTWMHLPGSLTGNSQGTTNTLRAWLRRGASKSGVEA